MACRLLEQRGLYGRPGGIITGSKDGDRTRPLPKCMRTAHGVPTICALALWFGAVWIAEEDSHNLHGPNGGHGPRNHNNNLHKARGPTKPISLTIRTLSSCQSACGESSRWLNRSWWRQRRRLVSTDYRM